MDETIDDLRIGTYSNIATVCIWCTYVTISLYIARKLLCSVCTCEIQRIYVSFVGIGAIYPVKYLCCNIIGA